MSELMRRPSEPDVIEVIEGELIFDDEIDDEVGPCRGGGQPCGDYRCCQP